MKYLSFFFIFALVCICFMQTEASSRTRREDDTLEQLQKKLAEGFDSVKKAAEEMAAKVDFKQLQQDFTTKLEELGKSFSELTSAKNEEAPAAAAAAASP